LTNEKTADVRETGKMPESRQREMNSFPKSRDFLKNFSKCLKTDGLFENKQRPPK